MPKANDGISDKDLRFILDDYHENGDRLAACGQCGAVHILTDVATDPAKVVKTLRDKEALRRKLNATGRGRQQLEETVQFYGLPCPRCGTKTPLGDNFWRAVNLKGSSK